jgi:hypothetical protein
MKKFSLITAALVVISVPANADDVIHYACHSKNARYALTVHPDQGIVKMQEQAPPHTLTTFRILQPIPACGKGGWTLSDGAVFCYATQGVGTLSWHRHEIDCDQADTE